MAPWHVTLWRFFFIIFGNTRARRSDNIDSSSNLFAKLFFVARDIEDSDAVERIMEIWDDTLKVSKFWESLCGTQTIIKNLSNIQEATKDNIILPKVYLLQLL